MTTFMYWLAWRRYRHIAGHKLHLWYGSARKRFLRSAWPYRCAACSEKVKREERTVDHIIPVWLCIELDLFELIHNPLNFQLMHERCNIVKNNRVDLKSLLLLVSYLNIGRITQAKRNISYVAKC